MLLLGPASPLMSPASTAPERRHVLRSGRAAGAADGVTAAGGQVARDEFAPRGRVAAVLCTEVVTG